MRPQRVLAVNVSRAVRQWGDDVMAAVDFARENGLELAVRVGDYYAAPPCRYSLRAVSGPVIRRSTGRVEAMIASDARRPAATMV